MYMNSLNSYVGKRIKEYREVKGYTQEYMAKELDIATNHYGRIERGENSCTMNNLVSICNILEVNPNDILGELIINKDNELLKDLDKLSVDNRIVASKFVKFLLHNQK